MGAHRGIVVCGQCRRPMMALVKPAVAWDEWMHTDGTSRCAPGTYDAVRMLLTVRLGGWLDRPWAG